jgi:hypothetical protein
MIYATCAWFLVGAALALFGRRLSHRYAGEVITTVSAVFLVIYWGQW